MPAVTVMADGLTRRFGNFVAVDHVSFDIQAGQIWGFLGPNGAGKSTTIRMLCGILDPSEGRGEVLGYDVVADAENVKQRIGYMSQRFSLWLDLTVRENMEFYAGVYGLDRATTQTRVDAWLSRLDLQTRQRRVAASLSGGYRQRLALACSVLHQPRVLFLDEPTSGLDPSSRRTFWSLIDEFAAEGVTTMITTHYMDEAEHCDQLAFILGGRLMARGTPAEVKRLHMRGVITELMTDHPGRALALLEKDANVWDAARYGSALHITVADENVSAQVTAALQDAGLTVTSCLPVSPTLEDVFVSLAESSPERLPMTDRGAEETP